MQNSLKRFKPDVESSSESENNSESENDEIQIISEIVPNKLYLSDYQSANQKHTILDLNIRGMISIGTKFEQTLYEHYVNLQQLHVIVEDCETENIELAFESVRSFINAINGPVLIHCVLGISRSPTFTIYYLMKEFNLSFEEAFDKLKQKRPCIDPNEGFIKKLKQA